MILNDFSYKIQPRGTLNGAPSSTAYVRELLKFLTIEAKRSALKARCSSGHYTTINPRIPRAGIYNIPRIPSDHEHQGRKAIKTDETAKVLNVRQLAIPAIVLLCPSLLFSTSVEDPIPELLCSRRCLR